MQIINFHCLIFYIIFCSHYYFVSTFLGENVRKAKKDEFPFIVSLVRIDNSNPQDETKHWCTGSMITRSDVAIASHCFQDNEVTGVQIKVGLNDLRKGRKYSIYWWINFEHWAVRKRMQIEFDTNDVANLRLYDKVHRSVKPIKLGFIENSQLYNKKVTVVGWSWSNLTYMDPMLKVAELTVLSNDDCLNRIERVAGQRLPMDPRHALCTVAEPYILLTHGASGGPVVYNNKIVGINFGICPNNMGDTNPQLVNLHMSIHYYHQFFTEVLAQKEN